MEANKISNVITNAVAFWLGKDEKDVDAGDVAKVFTASVFWPITLPIWLVQKEIQRSNEPTSELLEEGKIVSPSVPKFEIIDIVPDPTRSYLFTPVYGFKSFSFEYELVGEISRWERIVIELKTNPNPTAKFEVVKYKIKNLKSGEIEEGEIVMGENYYPTSGQKVYRGFIAIPREFYFDERLQIVIEIEGMAEFTEQFDDSNPKPTILTFAPVIESD